MMTFRDVRANVLRGGAQGPVFDGLRMSLTTGAKVDEIAQGRMSVGEALAMYSIRQHAVVSSGVKVGGLSELLLELSALRVDEGVSLFHFGTADMVFTVVVSQPRGKMLGCVSAARRVGVSA